MAVNSRRKGKNGERAVAKLLTDWTGSKFASTPASGGLRWQKANVAGDVVCTEEGVYFPFCIEVKFHKEINFSHLLYKLRITKANPNGENKIDEFWAQATRDAKKANKIPLLFMRYNSMPADFFFIVMKLKDFNHFKNELNLSWPYMKVSGKFVIMNQNVLLDTLYYPSINNLALSLTKWKSNTRG